MRERRTIRPDFDEESRFVESIQITPTTPSGETFRQPVSVVALADGTFWVSYNFV